LQVGRRGAGTLNIEDGDTLVDLDDLTILGTFWNSGVTQADAISFDAALQTALLTIPEPVSLLLLGIGSICVAGGRRRN